jgi:hypothetical protein
VFKKWRDCNQNLQVQVQSLKPLYIEIPILVSFFLSPMVGSMLVSDVGQPKLDLSERRP